MTLNPFSLLLSHFKQGINSTEVNVSKQMLILSIFKAKTVRFLCFLMEVRHRNSVKKVHDVIFLLFLFCFFNYRKQLHFEIKLIDVSHAGRAALLDCT